MTKLINFLKGKKTYIISFVVAVLAGLTYYGIVIPEYVWMILAAAGLGTIRDSIAKLKEK